MKKLFLYFFGGIMIFSFQFSFGLKLGEGNFKQMVDGYVNYINSKTENNYNGKVYVLNKLAILENKYNFNGNVKLFFNYVQNGVSLKGGIERIHNVEDISYNSIKNNFEFKYLKNIDKNCSNKYLMNYIKGNRIYYKNGIIWLGKNDGKIIIVNRKLFKCGENNNTNSDGKIDYKKYKGEGNKYNQSFNKSKKILAQQIYNNNGKTIYCGCDWNSGKVNLNSCGYKEKSSGMLERAKRVEWEHVVPAQSFGQSFFEWRNGHEKCIDSKGVKFKGRKCAEKMNVKYRFMQSDLYNLFPAIGEVNGRRSNYDMGMITNHSITGFGSCGFKIDTKQRLAEPYGNTKGIVARTYMYMNMSYPGRGIMNSKKEKLYKIWDNQYPVTKEECELGKKIEKIQGNINFILKERCKNY